MLNQDTSTICASNQTEPVLLFKNLRLPIKPQCEDKDWNGRFPQIELRARNWSEDLQFPNTISPHCAACLCLVSSSDREKARALAKKYFSCVKNVGFGLIKQNRVGQHGRTIKIKKIQTMRETPLTRKAVKMHSKTKGGKNPRDPSITRIGAIIRTLHIDETPQIRDVLRGKLKLVGFRPYMLVESLLFPPEFQKKLNLHKPGLFNILHLRDLRSGRIEEEVRAISAYLKLFEKAPNQRLLDIRCLLGILHRKILKGKRGA